MLEQCTYVYSAAKTLLVHYFDFLDIKK